MCLTKLPVIDFSIGSICAGDEIISFDRGDTSTKDTSIGFVPSKPAQLVLVYGLTNWPFHDHPEDSTSIIFTLYETLFW
jgi:hypothetical protein